MNRRDHQRHTGARRLGRRLTLLALALALAGCGGGRDGTDVGVPPGPTIGVPTAPTTSGPDASGAGGGPAVTAPSNPTAPPTSTGGASVVIEVGGPSLNIPGGPLPAPLQSFGEVAVGAESVPHRFRLRSLLGDTVDVVALRIDDDGSFPLTDDQCSGATLEPGGSGGCTFTVVFRPGEQGAATGTLLVRLTQRCAPDADPPCGAVLTKGRVALVTERTAARLVGHGTPAQ